MWLAQLSWWLQQGLMIWLFALAGLIAYRFVVNPSRLAGMLTSDRSPGELDPERVQLAITMPVALATYLGEAAKRYGELQAGADKIAMPEAPPALLTIVAGSQLFFLAGKVLRSSERKAP